MKKLLVILGMLCAAASFSYASDSYEANKINHLSPTSIRYYDTDLCRWWTPVRLNDGRMVLACNSTGRAQVADAFSVQRELEALKKRVEELEKEPVEDK